MYNKSKSILFNFGSGEGFFISVDFFSYFPETINLQLHYLYNYSFQKLSQMALAKSKLLTPGTAILIGGVLWFMGHLDGQKLFSQVFDKKGLC